jgi:hypothetical protein
MTGQKTTTEPHLLYLFGKNEKRCSKFLRSAGISPTGPFTSLPWASAAPVTLFGSADAHDVSSHWLRQSDYVGGLSSFKLKPPRPKQRAFQVVGMSAFDEFCIICGCPMIPFILETNPAGTVPPLFLH